MSSADAAPSGFNGFLEQAGLNIVEFAICLAFWVGMIILSSVMSLGDILSKSLPAIASTPLHLPVARPLRCADTVPSTSFYSQASDPLLSSSTASPRCLSTCLLLSLLLASWQWPFASSNSARQSRSRCSWSFARSRAQREGEYRLKTDSMRDPYECVPYGACAPEPREPDVR